MSDLIDGFRATFGARANSTPAGKDVTPVQLNQPVAPSGTPSPAGGYDWHYMNKGTIDPHDTYDDIFPYTNAIAQRFCTVIPFAVDGNGDQIDPPPQAMSALYAPNDSQSCLEFLKFIAATILTQTHLDILVWTRDRNGRVSPGGVITPDNIAGYTFLPLGSRKHTNDNTGDYVHQVNMTIDGVRSPRTFTRMETIALGYSQHPEDPTRGISPAMTIQKWATLNDCIADYEQGFFDNGAVPAGMLGVVADNAQDYTRTRDRLEDTFRGAGNNNGVIYNYIPVNPVTRKPEDHGKIVWVPFQQPNNSLDLPNLDSMVVNRLGSAMGVPDIVRGIDDSQTYDNAQMAERSFIENTLKPLLMTVWDKFQFELDRITGGLGYAINFQLDLPAQTDVEHIQAETQNTQVATLINLVNAGAKVGTAVRALGLPDEYADLELQPATSMAAPQITDTQQDEQPSQPIINISSRDVTTKDQAPFSHDPAHDHEDRFRKSLMGKARRDYDKVLTLSREMLEAVIEVARTSKNDKSDELGSIAVEWVDGTYSAYQQRVIDYAKRNGVTLKQAVIELAKTDPDIKAILDSYTSAEITSLFDWGEDLPDRYKTSYRDRLNQVALDSVHNGFSSVQDLLAKADEEGWSKWETEKALREFVNGPRAELLARNELVNAERLGALYSASNMADDMGLDIVKVWSAVGSNPCPFCKHMDGESKPLHESFMELGESIEVAGKTYVNDFASKQTCDGHPRCECVLTYKVKGVK